jgi:hypothetical protein
VRDATGTYAYDIYFDIVIVLGTFFILNLMVAVQTTYLSQQFEEDRLKLKD